MYMLIGCFLLIRIASVVFCERSNIKVIILENEVVNIYCDTDKSNEKSDFSKNAALKNGIRIEFNSCKFSQLPQTFLVKCIRAREIHLSLQGIQLIKGENFLGNRHLKKLNLQLNLISELPAFLFVNTPKIEEVNFARNRIERIDSNAFAAGVECLKKINLEHNKIKTLDGRTFANAISLAEVNLKFNQIEKFSAKPIRLEEWHRFDKTKENTSSSCMIFPFKSKKILLVNLALNKLTNVEVNCDSDTRYLLSRHDDYCVRINGSHLHLLF